MVSRIKIRCQKKSLPFDLDEHEEEINARVVARKCELTGLPLREHHGSQNWDSPSLDRVTPHLGYLYSNIRVVCFGVNAALGNWGEQAFERIATAYLERRN